MSNCHRFDSFAFIPEAKVRCPLDGNVMKNAARSKVCGHSFGLKCILDYLVTKDCCPTCSKPLDISDLEPHQALRDTIDGLDCVCQECHWRGAFDELADHACGQRESADNPAATPSPSQPLFTSPVQAPATTEISSPTPMKTLNSSNEDSVGGKDMPPVGETAFIFDDLVREASEEVVATAAAVDSKRPTKCGSGGRLGLCPFARFGCEGGTEGHDRSVTCSTDLHMLLLSTKVVQLEQRCLQLEMERENFNTSMSHGGGLGVTPQRTPGHNKSQGSVHKFKTPMSQKKRTVGQQPRVPLRPRDSNTAATATSAGGAKSSTAPEGGFKRRRTIPVKLD